MKAIRVSQSAAYDFIENRPLGHSLVKLLNPNPWRAPRASEERPVMHPQRNPACARDYSHSVFGGKELQFTAI
jgi:hypothetical protein